ncbi:MAG: tetratricopeptide repeat protein [Paracoccus marcusii]
MVPIAAAGQGLHDAFARLAQPEGEGWRIAESDILREWSRSGSPAMDLLLQRGEAALDMGDIPSAIGHLTALTDHAPDFAAGFQTRAAAYATAGQFGPALADLRRTLELEPRHFAALTQLGAMLEEMGDDARALAAYRASLAIHPHQQEAIDGQARLEHKRIGTDI